MIEKINQFMPHVNGASSFKILYLGPVNGNCLLRANALRRLGHRVEHIDLRDYLPPTKWVDRLAWRLGGQWFDPWITAALARQLPSVGYDLCYVDGGEWCTPSIVNLLRRQARKVISYNSDDPLGTRDGARFRAYRQSLPCYDLCVVMHPENIAEAKALGARNVMRVYRSADEVAHAPRKLTRQAAERWGSDVLFLGTWFPERGPFLLELLERGVPLTIRGARWHKAPEWPLLRPHWRGGPIGGDDYAMAIQCAKVNLGLVSKGNRDLHTRRSLEIPALGGLLCAERTAEHLAMYDEGKEALFWSDARECAARCRFALENEPTRVAMAAAGRSRVTANGHYNENILRDILDAIDERHPDDAAPIAARDLSRPRAAGGATAR